jgi:hypothetical protein
LNLSEMKIRQWQTNRNYAWTINFEVSPTFKRLGKRNICLISSCILEVKR